MTIKHISFDVWNTLLEPNPFYAKERTELLSIVSSLDKATCSTIYSRIKHEADSIRLDGKCYSNDDLFVRLIDELKNQSNKEVICNSEFLKKSFNLLFEKYPPYFSSRIKEMLLRLKMSGYMLSIGSNSNFISGSTMHKFLVDELKSNEILSFAAYSDLIGYAKPHYNFFRSVISVSDYTENEILHIGDSYDCDIVGASSAGIKTLFVDKPSSLPKLLNSYLEKNK